MTIYITIIICIVLSEDFIKEVAKLMNTLAEVYPDCEVTFANNKVPVNTLSYDAKSNSINLR